MRLFNLFVALLGFLNLVQSVQAAFDRQDGILELLLIALTFIQPASPPFEEFPIFATIFEEITNISPPKTTEMPLPPTGPASPQAVTIAAMPPVNHHERTVFVPVTTTASNINQKTPRPTSTLDKFISAQGAGCFGPVYLTLSIPAPLNIPPYYLKGWPYDMRHPPNFTSILHNMTASSWKNVEETAIRAGKMMDDIGNMGKSGFTAAQQLTDDTMLRSMNLCRAAIASSRALADQVPRRFMALVKMLPSMAARLFAYFIVWGLMSCINPNLGYGVWTATRRRKVYSAVCAAATSIDAFLKHPAVRSFFKSCGFLICKLGAAALVLAGAAGLATCTIISHAPGTLWPTVHKIWSFAIGGLMEGICIFWYFCPYRDVIERSWMAFSVFRQGFIQISRDTTPGSSLIDSDGNGHVVEDAEVAIEHAQPTEPYENPASAQQVRYPLQSMSLNVTPETSRGRDIYSRVSPGTYATGTPTSTKSTSDSGYDSDQSPRFRPRPVEPLFGKKPSGSCGALKPILKRYRPERSPSYLNLFFNGPILSQLPEATTMNHTAVDCKYIQESAISNGTVSDPIVVREHTTTTDSESDLLTTRVVSSVQPTPCSPETTVQPSPCSPETTVQPTPCSPETTVQPGSPDNALPPTDAEAPPTPAFANPVPTIVASPRVSPSSDLGHDQGIPQGATQEMITMPSSINPVTYDASSTPAPAVSAATITTSPAATASTSLEYDPCTPQAPAPNTVTMSPFMIPAGYDTFSAPALANSAATLTTFPFAPQAPAPKPIVMSSFITSLANSAAKVTTSPFARYGVVPTWNTDVVVTPIPIGNSARYGLLPPVDFTRPTYDQPNWSSGLSGSSVFANDGLTTAVTNTQAAPSSAHGEIFPSGNTFSPPVAVAPVQMPVQSDEMNFEPTGVPVLFIDPMQCEWTGPATLVGPPDILPVAQHSIAVDNMQLCDPDDLGGTFTPSAMYPPQPAPATDFLSGAHNPPPAAAMQYDRMDTDTAPKATQNNAPINTFELPSHSVGYAGSLAPTSPFQSSPFGQHASPFGQQDPAFGQQASSTGQQASPLGQQEPAFDQLASAFGKLASPTGHQGSQPKPATRLIIKGPKPPPAAASPDVCMNTGTAPKTTQNNVSTKPFQLPNHSVGAAGSLASASRFKPSPLRQQTSVSGPQKPQPNPAVGSLPSAPNPPPAPASPDVCMNTDTAPKTTQNKVPTNTFQLPNHSVGVAGSLASASRATPSAFVQQTPQPSISDRRAAIVGEAEEALPITKKPVEPRAIMKPYIVRVANMNWEDEEEEMRHLLEVITRLNTENAFPYLVTRDKPTKTFSVNIEFDSESLAKMVEYRLDEHDYHGCEWLATLLPTRAPIKPLRSRLAPKTS